MNPTQIPRLSLSRTLERRGGGRIRARAGGRIEILLLAEYLGGFDRFIKDRKHVSGTADTGTAYRL